MIGNLADSSTVQSVLEFLISTVFSAENKFIYVLKMHLFLCLIYVVYILCDLADGVQRVSDDASKILVLGTTLRHTCPFRVR